MNNFLNVCPSTLQSGYSSYSPTAIKNLFGGEAVSPFLDFSFDESSVSSGADNTGRISVSGVQIKYAAIIENGKIKLRYKDEPRLYILKPTPVNFALSTKKQIPANEHLTMQIASQVYGIKTAQNGLCFTSKGSPVYITRRFDYTESGERIHLEDFASLIGKNELNAGNDFKYEASYYDIAVAIKQRVTAWPIAMSEFFKLLIFSYIHGNGDNHLKNFSILKKMDGEVVLAPAYDLMNTSIHLDGDDLGLYGGFAPDFEKSEAYERTGHPCSSDFINFGSMIGLNSQRVITIVNEFRQLPQLTEDLVSRSFLNEKMRRSYLRVVRERIARFNRE